MRDIEDKGIGASFFEENDVEEFNGWYWYKGALMLFLVATAVGYGLLQHSVKLEIAAIGERKATLADVVAETKERDRLRGLEYELSAPRDDIGGNVSDKDREGLIAIIKGSN